MSMHGHLRMLTPSQIALVKREPSGVRTLLSVLDRRQVDVHKAWHGLHFLLTGEAGHADGPLAFIAVGGEAVGDDLGSGPARVIDPDATRAIADALDALGLDEIGARFDPDRMTELEIYPGGWRDKAPRWRCSLMQHLEEVRTLVREARDEGAGVLIWLSDR